VTANRYFGFVILVAAEVAKEDRLKPVLLVLLDA